MRSVIPVLFACLLAVSSVLPAFAQDGDTVPRFEPAPCPFDTTPGMAVECGFVVVPEEHGNPDSGTIRLSVVRFPAQSDNVQPDPVIMLSGGPGEKTTASALNMATIFAPISPDRDLIVFDQRGVGLSEPALECPEWTEAQYDTLDEVDPEEALRKPYEALLACGARLESEGDNLSAYNSLENAADVADIVTALGYEQANLIGISYGSQLAQFVMRDHPEVVRSAIIDSVLPIDASFFISSLDTSYAALNRLLDACAADETCSTAYPDLRQVLFDTVDQLNAGPVPMTLTDPLTGDTYDAYLNGDGLIGTLMYYLYQAPTIPMLPSAIYDVAQGNYDVITQLNSSTLLSLNTLSRGMEYSVFCAQDPVGHTSEEYLERLNSLPPQVRGTADIEVQMEYNPIDGCAQWPVEPLDPADLTPLVTDLPVLVLAGQFDPVTPFSHAEHVAANLSHAYLYEIPAVGHSVLVSSTCADSVATQYIDDPSTEPDTACIDALAPVEFYVTGQAITMVPMQNDTFGFAGAIPDGWQELSPGVYAESMMSQSVLLEQALPGDEATVTTLLAQQLGMASFPEADGTREANGLTWTLYTFDMQGQPSNLAVTSSNGTGYLIWLITTATQHDDYYTQIFLPAVDALTPLG
jgi:pimeloyl-ACP methyl ester carboxylesterase